MGSRATVWAWVVALAFAAAPAKASVVLDVSIEEMTLEATAVVQGQVRDVGVRFVRGAGGAVEPFTVTTLRVERWLKGDGPAEVRIWERGGTFPGGRVVTSGSPRYRGGERVVAFLELDAGGRWRTYGLSQGRFLIRAAVPGATALVERDLRGLSLASWSGGRMQLVEAGVLQLPLDDLLMRVRDVLGGRE